MVICIECGSMVFILCIVYFWFLMLVLTLYFTGRVILTCTQIAKKIAVGILWQFPWTLTHYQRNCSLPHHPGECKNLPKEVLSLGSPFLMLGLWPHWRDGCLFLLHLHWVWRDAILAPVPVSYSQLRDRLEAAPIMAVPETSFLWEKI